MNLTIHVGELAMDGLRKAQLLKSAGVSDEAQSPESPGNCQGTGLVLAYPDRFYADHKGLTFLDKLRQHLPKAEYYEALPARVMECCREVRHRMSVEYLVQLELTGAFDLGEQALYFRVLSLPMKRPSHRRPVLILLDMRRQAEPTKAPHSQ
jgi:hypothetical protein